MRKCRAIAAVEMAEVTGVRTRARALALTAVAVAAASSGSDKKRKDNCQELNISIKLRNSSATTRRRRCVTIKPENSVSSYPEVNSWHRSVIEDRCSSPSSASCRSSNGSSERIKFPDPDKEERAEGETSMDYSCRERRETTTWSEVREELLDDLDSTARPSGSSSRRRSTAAEKMPTEAELEEFFAEAEKGLKKQFVEKYNYDIEKDMALEGRWEWVRLKP
ncbi:hypothetical protein K2173_006266 [Erythroxylum novogranatense]|uniref:Cyclin-dependent kinase inhibitor n=1 Tax=Erythroxylum novogranatense TaxID=1862640 RepID=A0AAV8TCJ0_9ROSI|nr:hypothetical protein K2173_006266 [Erythroxylum novogranatense]